MLRRLAFFAILALAACKEASPPESPQVEQAWIRLPAAPGSPGAGYFTLRGLKPGERLTAITSQEAQRIELHDSMMQGGMMHMAPLASAPADQHGTLEFKPGGKHAMIFGIVPSVKPGAKVGLHFQLGSASFDGEARVVGAGDPAPADE